MNIQRRAFHDRQELLKVNKIAAGLLSERFPSVSGAVIQVTYYKNVSTVTSMVRTMNFFPSSFAYFIVGCMAKGCSGGGYDLSEVFSALVKGRKAGGKGKLSCAGNGLASGHGDISYVISISYAKRAK